MPEIPKQVPPKSPFHVSWNNILQLLRALKLVSSGDILVKTTNNGTSLELHPRYKQTTPAIRYESERNYRLAETNEDETPEQLISQLDYIDSEVQTDSNIYNRNRSYKKGDIIRVLANQQPYNIYNPATSFGDLASNFTKVNWAGSPISFSIVDNTIPAPEGTYICVCNVPPSSSLVWADLSASGDFTTTRNPDVCYHPIVPEPNYNAAFFNGGTNTVNSGSTFEYYQGRYWEKIGGGTTAAPASPLKPYYIMALSHSYVEAKEILFWSGSSPGNPTGSFTTSSYVLSSGSYFIAKPPVVRNIKKTVPVDGVDMVYFPSSGDTNRCTVSSSYGSELAVVTPRYYVHPSNYALGKNSVIYATDVGYTGVYYTYSSSVSASITTSYQREITLQDTNADARMWYKEV